MQMACQKSLEYNLTKIPNIQKRERVLKELNILNDEMNKEKFTDLLDQFKKEMLTDSETSIFFNYFVSHYNKSVGSML